MASTPPDRENARLGALPLMSGSTASSAPLARFQKLTFPTLSAMARNLPFGLNATLRTGFPSLITLDF